MKKIFYKWSTKRDGNMSFRIGNKEHVINNRKRFVESVGIHWSNVLLLPVSHGNRVLSLPKRSKCIRKTDGSYFSGGHIFSGSTNHCWEDKNVGIDAMVTNNINFYCAVLPADCAVVGFFDQKKNVFGCAHVGLLGAASSIVSNVLRCMTTEYKVNVFDLKMFISPSIRACHYNLSHSGIYNTLRDKVLGNDFFFRFLTSTNCFDLQGLIIEEAIQFGVREENIFDSGLCTVCNNDSFFSNFTAKTEDQKKKEGRFLSIFGIQDEK